MNKKLPLWVTLMIVWIFLILIVGFGWAVWSVGNGRNTFSKSTGESIIFVAKIPALINQTYHEIMSEEGANLMLTSERAAGIDGLQIKAANYVDSNYLLLSSYDKTAKQSTIKLLRLSDQKVMHQWVPNVEDALKYFVKNDSVPWQIEHNVTNFRMLHPLLSNDGTIYYNFIFSPLIKMGPDAKIIWSVPGMFHHSTEFDSEGNIWAPALDEHSKFASAVFKDYKDDKLVKVSPEGKILFEKSISQILLDNGYRGLLWGVGLYEEDEIHLNDIQPALTSSAYWEKGDLLVSLRNKSTVFLYRPGTNKILWLKTGPWLSQHDVDFLDDKRIGIFGNDVVRGDKMTLLESHNEQYIYDFSTDSLQTPYTAFFKGANVATLSEGRTDILPNGDLFIEETEHGRLLRGSFTNTIWQFAERINPKSVAALSWSRFVTYNKFDELTFLKTK